VPFNIIYKQIRTNNTPPVIIEINGRIYFDAGEKI
jgi:hypothetical protein